MVSLMALEPIREHLPAFMFYNEAHYKGYLGLDERSSLMPIHQADTYLSKKRTEMRHCSHTVVTRVDAARLVMGL